jgi:glycosyltransferase involved in cell wall biosynthesis
MPKSPRQNMAEESEKKKSGFPGKEKRLPFRRSPQSLRIALVAPVALPVAPDSTGSIEQLVWQLAEELIRRGHEVTLFATGDSQSSAALHAVYSRGYEDDDSLWDYLFHESMNMAAAMERACDFDVIHSHVYHHALPFVRLVPTPIIHNYHVLPDPDIVSAFARYPEAHIVAISEYQRQIFKDNPNVTVVHHGIDTKAFPFHPAAGDYLLFLGRIVPGKGTVEAIHLANKVGMRLIIAGPRDDQDEGYFETEVAPLIDNRLIEFIGGVSLKDRLPLLAKAAALVYPITAPEPFGLVMIEALVCGTPVLATRRGAVPELVQNGVNGFFTDDWQSLADRFPETLKLDRSRIRKEAMARFDNRRMVDEYETVYQRLAAQRNVE